MILIVSNRDDLHADWVIVELQRRGLSFARFNTEDYPQVAEIAWSDDPGRDALRLSSGSLRMSEVEAVWYRRPVPPVMPTDVEPGHARWASGEAREALLGLWRTVDAVWVNHPDRNYRAESKQLQLRTAAALGFEVPSTLISSDGRAVGEFMDALPDGLICKPLRDGRIDGADGDAVFFSTRVTADVDLDQLGPEPYLFQEFVDKLYDVRVTVVGDEAFACRIESQGDTDARTDWRRGDPRSLPHRCEDLPDQLAEQCVALCRDLGLRFGAIDLARRPDGGYSFFEINPNGQWVWVEQRTGLPIRDRLVTLLAEGP